MSSSNYRQWQLFSSSCNNVSNSCSSNNNKPHNKRLWHRLENLIKMAITRPFVSCPVDYLCSLAFIGGLTSVEFIPFLLYI